MTTKPVRARDSSKSRCASELPLAHGRSPGAETALSRWRVDGDVQAVLADRGRPAPGLGRVEGHGGNSLAAQRIAHVQTLGASVPGVRRRGLGRRAEHQEQEKPERDTRHAIRLVAGIRAGACRPDCS
jgi:hypothetical protein